MTSSPGDPVASLLAGVAGGAFREFLECADHGDLRLVAQHRRQRSSPGDHLAAVGRRHGHQHLCGTGRLSDAGPCQGGPYREQRFKLARPQLPQLLVPHRRHQRLALVQAPVAQRIGRLATGSGMQVLASHLLEQFATPVVFGGFQQLAGDRAVFQLVGLAALRADRAQQLGGDQLQAAVGYLGIVASIGRRFAEEHVFFMLDQALQQPDGRLQLLLFQQLAGLQQPLSQSPVGDVHHPGLPLGVPPAGSAGKRNDAQPDLSVECLRGTRGQGGGKGHHHRPPHRHSSRAHHATGPKGTSV